MNTKKSLHLFFIVAQRSLFLWLLTGYIVAGCTYRTRNLSVRGNRQYYNRAGHSCHHSMHHLTLLDPRAPISTAWTRFWSCYNAPWSKKGPKLKRFLCMCLPATGISTSLFGIVYWLTASSSSGAVSNHPLLERKEVSNGSLFNETLTPPSDVGLDSATTAFILTMIENASLFEAKSGDTTFSPFGLDYSQEDTFSSVASAASSTVTVASSDSNKPLVSAVATPYPSLPVALDLDKMNSRHDVPVLIESVNQGDISYMKALLKRGADVNAVDDEYGASTLIRAVQKGRRDMVDILMANHVDVNIRNKNNQTALMFAVRDGYKDLAQELLKRNADVHVVDDSGYTALWVAVEYNRKDFVEILLGKGSDVNEKDKAGKAVLVYAVEKGYAAIVQCFLKHKDKLNVETISNALQAAKTENIKNILQQLLLERGNTTNNTESL